MPPCELLEQKFENFNIMGRFSTKKIAKMLIKFPGLATLGRHNSAMITYRLKLITKISLYQT